MYVVVGENRSQTWLSRFLLSLGPENENQDANILMGILQSPRKPGRVQCWHFWSSDSDNRWRHSQPRTLWARHLTEPSCEHTGQQMHISYLMFFSQQNCLRMHSRINLSCRCIARLVRLEQSSVKSTGIAPQKSLPSWRAISIKEEWHIMMTDTPWSGRM